ncbi:glycosyltransferase family 4 protein [Microbacterium aerolatum]|uniref:Glycosyl transferase n=1 Tax=Microbacterium aerolatum TaxID=153731 RepID=A0A511A9T1_9MICO|nr:glycosyltransferase family 4 protein [Microbacterium aerolatum]GEK84945.1 glycosyl transferase [Microbacterium aerolatum]GGB37421.1 glycosyl transferase [Microbacterium aerolatum]
MTAPRLLIASRLYPPEVSAGSFRLGALGRALARAGASVRVLTTVPPAHAPAGQNERDVDVRRWPVLRDSGGNVRGYVQYLSFDAPLLLRMLFTRYDVAVAESPPTTGLVVGIASALRRRPFAYYAADVWTDGVISMGAPRFVVSVMRMIERAVLRRARTVISVSDEVTERLLVLDADPARIATVGNGIDTDIFSPDVEPIADAGRYLIYTGTMSEWQQPEIFIHAFARIAADYPDVRLKFFGQGVVEASLRRIAEDILPGRVDFGGVVSPQLSARWIRGAAASLVSIVPGIGYDFARPTKTYAAAAVGTPVLFAGPATGARLVRDGGLGRAVTFDVDAVAAGMLDLLAEEANGTCMRLRPERASWARAHVSLHAVADRAVAAIAQATGEWATKLVSGSADLDSEPESRSSD